MANLGELPSSSPLSSLAQSDSDFAFTPLKVSQVCERARTDGRGSSPEAPDAAIPSPSTPTPTRVNHRHPQFEEPEVQSRAQSEAQAQTQSQSQSQSQSQFEASQQQPVSPSEGISADLPPEPSQSSQQQPKDKTSTRTKTKTKAKTKTKTIVVKRKPPPKKSKWDDPQRILTDPKSPLAKANLRSILSHPMAWSVLEPHEKAEILSLFPDKEHILDPDTDSARPNLPSLLNDDSFRYDCAAFTSNLAMGRHDPEWLACAWAAHERRRIGDFNDYLIDKLQDDWAVDLPEDMKLMRPRGPESAMAPAPAEGEAEALENGTGCSAEACGDDMKMDLDVDVDEDADVKVTEPGIAAGS